MIDEWSPDPDVNCSLPDLRYVIALVLGAAVIVAALVIVAARKLSLW